MTPPEASPELTRMVDLVGRAGRPGRQLAVGLDLLRSTGLRYAWRLARDDVRMRRTWQRRRGGDPVYRKIWQQAAEEVGAEVRELPAGFLEIRRGDARTRVWRQWVMLDDAVTLRFSLQKGLVQQLLQADGLPIPEYLEFEASDPASAIEFLRRGPVPCVVKPAASSGGGGVTSGIRSEPGLTRARLRAARIDAHLIIERQVPGDAYRFLFLDGVLLDAIRRRPPQVTGDGSSTIDQLIAIENRRRLARRLDVVLWPLRVDLDLVYTLEAAGLTLSSVLPAGVTVPVKTVVSQNTIGDNETVTTGISSALIEEARAAVRVTGLRLAGVDLITTDISRPLAEAGGAIIEVNGTPGLHYHYEVADPDRATRVAVPVLKELLQLHADR